MSKKEYTAIAIIAMVYGSHRKYKTTIDEVESAVDDARIELGDEIFIKAESEANQISQDKEAYIICMGDITENFHNDTVTYIKDSALVRISLDLHDVLETVYSNMGW